MCGLNGTKVIGTKSNTEISKIKYFQAIKPT